MAQVTTEATLQSAGRKWIGDFLDREHLIAGGAKLDPAQFNAEDAVIATLTADASANATSVAVAALSGPIPNGTLLYFGGSKKLALLTAAAAAGATSLTVQALPTAMTTGDKATYPGSGTKKKLVPSGTVLGRTYSERDANTPFGPAGDSDDEVYLLVFDVTDAARNADVTLYRPGSVVKENLLDTFAALSSTLKAKIRGTYVCVNGAN
jgi:hypothetical protein